MISFIRSVLCAFCFFVFGLGCVLVSSAIFPIILLLYKSDKQRRIFVNTIHITWRAFVWLMCVLRLIKVKCNSRSELKKLKGTIVIANHPSLIDVVILVSLIPNSVCVVKNSLFHNVFVRKVIQKIYLSNTMQPDEFITRAADVLNNDYNIIIFPEGTRTIPNRPVHLHRGFAYLQIATKKDILPIKIVNSPAILGKLQKWWHVGNKPSIYNIIPQQCLRYDSDKSDNPRREAIRITDNAKESLFRA